MLAECAVGDALSVWLPRFIPEPWSACSSTCGPGVQVRAVRCRVLLAFARTEAELPEDECEGPRPPTERPCLRQACPGSPEPREPDSRVPQEDSTGTFAWEYAGFTPCTATCLGGRCPPWEVGSCAPRSWRHAR